MTTTDYLVDIALLLVVFRQIREGRIDARFVLIPLGIVAFVAHNYLHSIPTAGNDVVLIAVMVTLGAMLGIAGGFATRVRFDGEHALARAGVIAVTLWVLGMGSRMAFQLYSDHGGADAITRFSVSHHITSTNAWVTAFVLMAITEVATRVFTIVARAYFARRSAALTSSALTSSALTSEAEPAGAHG
jgi:hypothetical protein